MAAHNLTMEHVGELAFCVRSARGKAFRGREAMVRKWGDEADTSSLYERTARLNQLTTWLKDPKSLGAAMLALGAIEEWK